MKFKASLSRLVESTTIAIDNMEVNNFDIFEGDINLDAEFDNAFNFLDQEVSVDDSGRATIKDTEGEEHYLEFGITTWRPATKEDLE